jgi:hypothetical protein
MRGLGISNRTVGLWRKKGHGPRVCFRGQGAQRGKTARGRAVVLENRAERWRLNFKYIFIISEIAGEELRRGRAGRTGMKISYLAIP